MKFVLVVATMLLTVICWGIYGPVLFQGQMGFLTDVPAKVSHAEMANSSLRAFICVGLAYFFIAVVVPVTMLRAYGEKGSWTAGGLLWSLAAGAAGAIGALGVIFALRFGSEAPIKVRPAVYVMPLVFGGAPVINSIVTIYFARAWRQVGPLFLAGLIMVLLGSLTVLVSSDAAGFLNGIKQLPTLIKVLTAVAIVILAWGAYGPVLHKGQMAMQSSRLRPLICVGLAYFAIAVVVPGLMLSASDAGGTWSFGGTFWSLAAGAAGAIGALGVIMCFNFGGKPIYIMPLVFGGAPVVNTLIEVAKRGTGGGLSAFFFAGLILVIAGAAIVLVFAPRGHAPAAALKSEVSTALPTSKK